MSKGGSKQTAKIDPDLKREYLFNLGQARDVASRLYARPFSEFTADYRAGEQAARQNAFAGLGTLQQGINAARDTAGFVPMAIPNMDRSAYMNPYIDQVADRTMMDLDRQRQMMIDQIGDQAANAKAFGGDRHAVLEAETNRGFGDLFGNQMAAMRMAGFDNASGLMNADLQRQMQGQQLNLAGAGMLGNMASQQQQMGLGGAQALMNLGLGQQAFDQQKLDAIRNLPLEQQQLINQALAMYPGIGAQTAREKPNIFGNLIGAGGAVLGGMATGGVGLFG